MSAWLDALLGRIRNTNVEIPLGYGLNFTSGVRARLNTTSKFVDVDLQPDAVGPTFLAPESDGVGATFVVRIAMTAGTPGTADDVVGPAAPVALRIVDRWSDITTAIGGASVRVRTAAGGVGSSMSGIISADTAGDGIRADTGLNATQSTLAAGATPFVRRSDRGVAGTVYLLCVRT